MKAYHLIPLMFLTACSSTPKLALRPQPSPPLADNSAVRYPEVLRAYHFGRYVDPNDGLVMHEQHEVFRVEDNARWNLHPGPAGGSPLLPAPSRNVAFSPTPVNDSVLAEVNAQRLATAEIMAEAKILTGALARFQVALQQTKTNVLETAVLRIRVNDMQKQLAALKAAQAQNSASATPFSTNQPPDKFFDTNSPEFNP